MRITIVGGGNIGTQFAVHCAEKGHEVTVQTSAPQLFQKHLSIVDESGELTHQGDIFKATNDPKEAFARAELIMVTVPAICMEDVARQVFDYAPESTLIGMVPGNGGGECAFHECIERGNPFFAIERVPAVARLVEKGRVVRSTGYRDELHVAALPAEYTAGCCRLISEIFDKRCVAIPGFLNLTMTPSNPILHTTRLRTLFKDYHEGVVYSSVPLFYEEWSDETSELLLSCDDEVQQICRALPEFKLDHVKSLREHYESPTVEAMTRKISSIKAFKGLRTPTVSVEGGFIPDLHSRYFTADFSYGLTIIWQIAQFAGVKTPNIDATLSWYDGIALEKRHFDFGSYGIVDRATLRRFYLR